MALVRAIATTVNAAGDAYDARLAQFKVLRAQHAAAATNINQRLAKQMASWRPGLFLGDGAAEQPRRPDGPAVSPRTTAIPSARFGFRRGTRAMSTAGRTPASRSCNAGRPWCPPSTRTPSTPRPSPPRISSLTTVPGSPPRNAPCGVAPTSCGGGDRKNGARSFSSTSRSVHRAGLADRRPVAL